MYIMPGSRPTFFLISLAMIEDQPSVYPSAHSCFRWTIAFAGSRPFGQQFVQFMIPWHRYNFIVSFTHANRSSVN